MVSLTRVGVRFLILAALVVLPRAAAAQVEIIRVDCNRHQSITRALEVSRLEREVVIEIDGMCRENVIVTRDRVTLRGDDPHTDGIQAVRADRDIDAALWVRGAHAVAVENLKLTGGYAGLLATEVSTPHLRLTNVRLEDNIVYGVEVEASLLNGQSLVFARNGVNAGAFGGGRFGCTGCDFSQPLGGLGSLAPTNILVVDSRLFVSQSTLAGGGLSLNEAALARVVDSTIEGAPNSFAVISAATPTTLEKVVVSGALQATRGAKVQLLGVTQSGAAEKPNLVGEDSLVTVDNGPGVSGPSSAVLGFRVSIFGKVAVRQTSIVNGNIRCTEGANAVCAFPSNITGSVTGCALCVKPTTP